MSIMGVNLGWLERERDIERVQLMGVRFVIPKVGSKCFCGSNCYLVH